MNPILAGVDQVYVINLPHRTDRRREIEAQLRKAGSSLTAPNVTLFPAIRPEDPGAFPSVGAHGCFLSHLGVLRAALAAGHQQILVLEDDADFTPIFLNAGDMASRLLADDWDMAWIGHTITSAGGRPSGLAGEETFPLGPEVAVMGAHAVLFRQTALGAVIADLEAMLRRPKGDPKGGPMHLDGAYNWVRRGHPELRAVATVQEWVVQRASRTDIAEIGWKDRLPFVTWLRRLRNGAKAWLGRKA